ncbi:hypothetical protein CGCS363_v009514 [Colletotrichum siamense]|uniref:uncharacterized protein n=1 Tax=Colletotrichum siamense TaxID=690259 RepID=UPI0018729C55|nr:uncharacterized protein CGCS363_v009514 [Colletotrichum siamense]KAF5494578.1 hypothetical protein CGCS363_v009514 [Colletotrichum siamense]
MNQPAGQRLNLSNATPECFISACRDINPPYHLSHTDSRTVGCTKPPGLLSCSPPTGISAGHSLSRTGILSGSSPSLS